MATTKALELAQLADSVSVNANGEITNIGTLSSLDINDGMTVSGLSTISGNTTFSQGTRLFFGDNANTGFLSINASPSHAEIKEQGNNGHLYIKASNLILEDSDGNNFLYGTANGSVQLYYSNDTKLETTNTGVNVTGNMIASGFVKSESGTFAAGDSADAYWTQYTNNSVQFNRVGGWSYIDQTANNATTTGIKFRIGPSYTEAMVIDKDADVTISNNLTVSGDLIISGNTTSVNTNNLVIEDANITLANGAANSSIANGAGITVDGANATITYNSSDDEWHFNRGLRAASDTATLSLKGPNTGSTSGLILIDENDIEQVHLKYLNAGNTTELAFNGNGLDLYSNQTSSTVAKFGLGSNRYNDSYFNGKVGIGTETPGENLEVYQGSSSGGIRLHSTTADSYVKFENDTNTWFLSHDGSNNSGSNNSLQISEGGLYTRFMIAPGGNIGVNTNNPDYQLHVKGAGDIKIEDDNGGSSHLRLGASTSGTRDSEWKVKVSGSLDEFHIDHDYTAAGATSVGNVFKITGDTHSIHSTSSQPTIRPSLLMDFARSKRVDPRLNHVRATSATYYDGYSSTVTEENILRNSNALDTSPAQTLNATIASTTDTTAPDGSNDAWKVTITSAGATNFLQTDMLTPCGGQFTFSVFLKAGTQSKCAIKYIDQGTYSYVADVDLSAGTISVYSSADAVRIDDVGFGWYRCSITATIASNGNDTIMLTANSTQAMSVNDTIYTYGWQVEHRGFPSSYVATGVGERVRRRINTMSTAASGVPRIDHHPVTGECLGLFLEEGATNIIPYSQDFQQWAPNLYKVSDYSVAPDGTNTATLLTEKTSTNEQQVTYYNVGTVTSGNDYTFSIYAKKVTSDTIVMTMYGESTATYNLANGTSSGGGSRIEHVGDGWYRCILTKTKSNTYGNMYVGFSTSTYAGRGYEKAVLIWGAQCEAKPFATSYISTSGSQGSRNEDLADIGNIQSSDWYSLGRGTLFVEGRVNYHQTSQNLVSLYNTDSTNDWNTIFGMQNTGYGDGRYQANMYSTAYYSGPGANSPYVPIEQFVKGATSWDINARRVAIEGEVDEVDPADAPIEDFDVLSLTRLYQSGFPNKTSHIKKVAFYPNIMSAGELKALTEND